MCVCVCIEHAFVEEGGASGVWTILTITAGKSFTRTFGIIPT